MSIKTTLSVVFGLLFLVAGASCAEPEPQTKAKPVPQTKAKPVPQTKAKVVAESAIKMVDVAAAGTKFDPPVTVEQIPEGAWMCEMKTVHYASQAKGDCPICGMHLTQKTNHKAKDPH